MRTSTLIGLLGVALMAFGVFVLGLSYAKFNPVPIKLSSFAGTATSVRTSTTMYTRSHATFQLRQPNGELMQFSYKPHYKRFYYFAEHLRDGSAVEVITGPGGQHDIWGIKLDSQSLMTPIEAREARMADGWMGFGLALAFFIAALWVLHVLLDVRRRGF